MASADQSDGRVAPQCSEHDLERREALVRGDGPRIPPLRVSELNDDLLEIVASMIAVNAALGSRDQEVLTDMVSDHAAGASREAMLERLERLPEIVLTMLRHPDLFARLTALGLQLLGQGVLPGRDRELAILRIGWICQAPYEWGEHVLIAKSLGISSEEIARIVQGAHAPGWSEHDRALLRAAEELHETAMISDQTWQTLAKRFDERQLIELTVVIGQYQAIAYYQNSLRLTLHDGNAGLKAR